MSWDVVIFAPKADLTANQIRRAFNQIIVGKSISWPASYDFHVMLEQLNQEFPITSQGQNNSPWLLGSAQGDGYVFLKVIHSRVNEVQDLLAEVKGIENLVIFDVGKDTILQGGKEICREEAQQVINPLFFWRRWFSNSG